MKLFATAFAALVFWAGAAHASDERLTTLMPTEDLSLPFWCDWGYDWDERCYWDDSARLWVGGEADKVWRPALRFPIPAGVTVVAAELALWYGGECVGARRASRPCGDRSFELHAHAVHTPRWLAERELEFGEPAGIAELDSSAGTGWLVWDLTDLVSEWSSGVAANNGVLVKLAEGEEDYGSSGPLFASADDPDASRRPRLTIWFVPP
jgi:hypothetical protein